MTHDPNVKILENATRDDVRPWEPLNGRKPRVGDEVRQNHMGVASTAVVSRANGLGDLFTAENGYIGNLGEGTWYFRRAATSEESAL